MMLNFKLIFLSGLALSLLFCSKNSTESDDDLTGESGEALVFDGIDDYAWTTPNISAFSEATVELWFCPDTFGQYQNMLAGGVDHPGGNWDNGYYFGTHGAAGDGISFGFWTGRWNWQQTNLIPTNGQWYHMAASWGEQGIKTYINGQQTNNYAYLGPNQTYNIDLIGTSSWGNYFHGAIDEVRYWSVVRDSIQINKTMYNTLGSEYTETLDSGLVAYYKFDLLEDLEVDMDGADDIRDYSVSGNHGDTRGGPLLIESGAFSKYNEN